MKSKLIKIGITALIVLIVAGAAALICYNVLKNADSIEDTEAQQILAELLPMADEINEIIWGAGMEIAPGQDGILTTVTGPQYRTVAEDSPYMSTAELKEGILKVYSEDFYNKTIKYAAFEGAEGAIEDSVIELYPRYMDNDDGVLITDITNEGFNIGTEIDPTTAKVVETDFGKNHIDVSAVVAGKQRTVRLTLVLNGGEWRLDTPTY